jgi:hypothetical protein
MTLFTIDEERLETIALLLSGSPSLPHFNYRNRAKRFCYVIPVNNPSALVYSLAFRTDNPAAKPNGDDLAAVPITGETFQINGKDCVVCSFIAYSIFNGNSIVSSHCEKVTGSVPYVASINSNKLLTLGTNELLTTPILKIVNNVTDMAKYRK